jgi:general secretion pathway protein N
MARISPSHSHSPSASASPWGWAIGGLIAGALLATVLFAPARWLAALINQSSQGHVLLAQARGTVWNGSAQLQLAGGASSIGSMALPGQLAWRLRPGFDRASVNIKADVTATCCMAQALQVTVWPGWGGARVLIGDHLSNWPAGLLAGLGTPWNTIQAQGTLAVSSNALNLEWAAGRVTMAGRLQVDAQDMASRLSTLKPMGSYRLTLNGGAVNTLQLETLQGSLQLSGNGQWVGGKLRFDGVASAVPERQDALSNLLNIIGRRDGARAIIKVG